MEFSFNDLPNAVSQLFIKLESIEEILKLNVRNAQPQDDQLLTIAQAAQFLDVSVPTIYGYVHRSTIPVMKRSKRLYFSKQDLTEYLKQGRRKTVDEIATEANEYLAKRKGGVRNG